MVFKLQRWIRTVSAVSSSCNVAQQYRNKEVRLTAWLLRCGQNIPALCRDFEVPFRTIIIAEVSTKKGLDNGGDIRSAHVI